MRIAIIGGGLFGCTAAIYAARHDHDVHLFEIKNELMSGVSRHTFARLHRGAHYPRSHETGRECRAGEAAFRAEYGAAVIDRGRQYYIVAPQNSHVDRDEFFRFLANEEIPFENDGNVFRVVEPRVDLQAMAAIVKDKMDISGVNVHFGCGASYEMRDEFDKIVVATYSNNNAALNVLGCERKEHKFQVVEKPVVLLPKKFADVSVVVVDGPFGCIDPLDNTPLHVIGHVVESIHSCNVGMRAVVPDHLSKLIGKGIIRDPQYTRFKEMVDGLRPYIDGIGEAKHIGSAYMVRAVLAHEEATDKRPTLVQALDGQVSTIFSGKLGTACDAAKKTLSLIEHMEPIYAGSDRLQFEDYAGVALPAAGDGDYPPH